MTPQQIKKMREALGWSVVKAAAKFQVSSKTWKRWEEEPSKMMPIHAVRLEKLYKFTFGRELEG